MTEHLPDKISQTRLITLPHTFHHNRTNTFNQTQAVKLKMKEVIRDLLREKEVSYQKPLNTSKQNIGHTSYRCDSALKLGHSRVGTSMATQRNPNDSSVDGSTSISISKSRIVKLKKGKRNISHVVRYNLLRNCAKELKTVGVENVNKMIYNIPTHIVAIFKDHLIYDDANEFLHRYYLKEEAKIRLQKIAEYYLNKDKILPSSATWNLQKVLLKGKERKEKILRIKCADDINKNAAGSTFFNSKFMNSLAKEDLQNSKSQLPVDSVALSISSPQSILSSANKSSTKFLDLLDKLNDSFENSNKQKESSMFQAQKNNAPNPKCKNHTYIRNVLNLYVSENKRSHVPPPPTVNVEAYRNNFYNKGIPIQPPIHSATVESDMNKAAVKKCQTNQNEEFLPAHPKITKKRSKTALGSMRIDNSKIDASENQNLISKFNIGRNMKRIQSVRSAFNITKHGNINKSVGRNIINKTYKENSRSVPRIKVNVTSGNNTTATIIMHNCKVAVNSYLSSHTRVPSMYASGTGPSLGNMKSGKALKKIVCQTQRKPRSESVENSSKRQKINTERNLKQRPKMKIADFTMKSSYKI